MRLEELINQFKRKFVGQDFTWHHELLAVQFDITGEDGGVFYVEIRDGILSIVPYEYHDRKARVKMSLQTLEKFIDKKIDPVAAYLKGTIKAEGNLEQVLEIAKYA